MAYYDPKPMKRGDVLFADRINEIEAAIKRLENVRGGGGVDIRHSRGGLSVTGVAPSDKYIAKATSDFPARTGSTPGSGSIDLYWFNPRTGALETTGVSIETAYNASQNTMTSGSSIDSGMYCTAWQDPFGTWWVSPEECD